MPKAAFGLPYAISHLPATLFCRETGEPTPPCGCRSPGPASGRSIGKFGGTLVAARLTGLSWRDAAALGTLMNTRGLMELIVLNIGLDLGVISPTLFAMMVVMALVTTAATAPVLQWLIPTTSTEGCQPVFDPCSP